MNEKKSSATPRRPNGTAVKASGPEVALVTGFPHLIARRMAQEIVKRAPKARVILLVLEKHEADARAFVQKLPTRQRSRIEVQLGDVAAIDLGLAGSEVRRLVRHVTHIYHMAEISYLGLEKPEMRRVNVEGTRNILTFATECEDFQRLTHYSTAFVSGDRVGVVMEDELDEGQSFPDPVAQTKFEAEVLVRRACARLPITIVRPSIVVGDSKTGEIDRMVGPYYAIVLHLLSPRELRLPLPGSGRAPLNMVPIDFVARATYALSLKPEAKGQTFHLTDPNPLSSRRVIEFVAQKTGKKPPLGRIPARLTQLLMRAPGLEKILRSPRQALEHFNHFAIYNCRNTLAALTPEGITCPPFESYAEALISFVSQSLEARKRKKEPAEEETADSLDQPTPPPPHQEIS